MNKSPSYGNADTRTDYSQRSFPRDRSSLCYSFDMQSTNSSPWPNTALSTKTQFDTPDLQTAEYVFSRCADEAIQADAPSHTNYYACTIAYSLVSHSSTRKTVGLPHSHDQEARWNHRINRPTEMDLQEDVIRQLLHRLSKR